MADVVHGIKEIRIKIGFRFGCMYFSPNSDFILVAVYKAPLGCLSIAMAFLIESIRCQKIIMIRKTM